MSPERNRLEPVPDSRDERPKRHDPDGYVSRTPWPTTRSASLGLTAVLALALVGPTLEHELSSHVWPALLLPGLLATLTARLMFESADGALRGSGPRIRLTAAVAGATLGLLLMVAAARVLGIRQDLATILLTAGPAVLALIGAGLVRDLEVRVRHASRRVYFAGTPESLRELQRELRRSPEARLVGSVGAHAPVTADSLVATVRLSQATVLVLDRNAAQGQVMIDAAGSLREAGLHVRDLLSYYESEFKKVPLTELTAAWFLFEPPAAHRRAARAALRRVIAVATAALLLLLALPLICALMITVRLSSPGPAIFRQPRVGKDGALFTLFKLRTMTVADDNGAWATDQGHRITALGRILRRFRLDELPQLWNVLRGELALVGPRPEQLPIVQRLARQIPFYDVRHTVRPGLTGWAQVNLGYSGSLAGTRAKLERDLYYVKHRSLRLDLLILWLTLKAVFTDPR